MNITAEKFNSEGTSPFLSLDEDVSYLSLPVLIIIYMFFQYFAVPLAKSFAGFIVTDSYWVTACAGVFSFALGAVFASQLFHKVYKKPSKNSFIDRKDISVLYLSGILFILLGMLLKLKSCHIVANELDCKEYFERVMRPNYLYVSSACCFLLAFFLEAKFKFQFKIIVKIIILMLLVSFFIAISGIGRTLFMAFSLSFIIGVYSLFPKARNLKYLILLTIAVLGAWVLISYIKELSYPSSSSGPGLNISFMYVKVINRISQFHILDAVLKNWPKELNLAFYGWQDFFSLPSIFGSREYLDGNDFGHAIKILGEGDFVTGIAPTYIGDLYMRAGLFGVITGMFILGILFKGFDFLIVLLPLNTAICITMIMMPLMIHGVEDFIFLTLSTNLLMITFYLAVFLGMSFIFDRISGTKINHAT